MPTVWGLTPGQLHDRFWAARGVQVIRPGQEAPVAHDAELFLLMPVHLLTIFSLRAAMERLVWLQPRILWLRLNDGRQRGYRELALSDSDGQFRRFQRLYGGSDARLARAALTRESALANWWRSTSGVRLAWRCLQPPVPRLRRAALTVSAWTYQTGIDVEVEQFVHDLAQYWTRPDASVARACRVSVGVWRDTTADIPATTRFLGAAWIGAGRRLKPEAVVTGPAVLWDAPDTQASAENVDWEALEPTQKKWQASPRRRTIHSRYAPVKRLLDLVAAAGLLLLLLPLFGLIMAAIWLEDGRPFFFVHRRETQGGHEFGCLKFRSMRRQAEGLRGVLQAQNMVDGPQFYIQDDPRQTRVGRFLRRWYLDELPQLFNVLAGHMSLVGPRPSPRRENQYCPAWREARLSVRPGITGLWQVQRTRQSGLDFQEWIRFDLEYVERLSLPLDLWIIWKTLGLLLRKGVSA